MSTQQAHAFMKHARRNPDLRKRIEALEGADAIREMAAIAEEYGFHFNENEYREAVVDLSGGELSDESLRELLRQTGLEK
jgi:predicted ribosomally synthesized peptide with nif11-like leader